MRGLIDPNRKVAYIPNAIDFLSPPDAEDSSEGLIDESGFFLRDELGLQVELLDLKQFFGDPEALRRKAAEFGTIWVRGGNVFVLRRAMKLSGFDLLLQEQAAGSDVLYGGYSAGCCVLSPTLRGFDLCDDKDINPYNDSSDIVWDGLGILDFSFIPHYQSDHPESEAVSKVVDFYIEEGLPYRTFRDGEVLII